MDRRQKSRQSFGPDISGKKDMNSIDKLGLKMRRFFDLKKVTYFWDLFSTQNSSLPVVIFHILSLNYLYAFVVFLELFLIFTKFELYQAWK